MTKKRFNLRIVAAIVAYLAVTTMFASCDKTNGDDDDGNGNGNIANIDPKLVVPDEPWYTGLDVGRSDLSLQFYSNGKFEYIVYWTTTLTGGFGGILLWEELYKGTYSASNGTLTFKFTSAQHRESGENWKSIALPASLSRSYKLWVDKYPEYNLNYLDIGGPLPGANVNVFKDGYTLRLRSEHQ